ncbi:hypothetical protein HHL11_05570 [Ramlibacter sp. G-1-2-2]|uniref:histidine kinase n=2 Tax=Ramlibacter agri TaxID=2728837 RepID=A0A848H255_9BURK|nr:hypothetical protein [Ramlibacter agri]
MILAAALAALAWLWQRLRAERSRCAQLQRELAHATRFALAGQLGAGVLTEIAQPLAAILGKSATAELLLAQEAINRNELQRLLAELNQEGERAGAMAQRLVALLARRDAGPEAFDVHEMVADAARVLQAEAAARRIELILQPCALVPQVTWDRLQVQQVVLQLLSNAMDAMADTPAAMRRVVVSTRDAGALIEILVSDRGHGFGGRHTDALFQPWYTTKANGLGLGLPVARTIVEAHGGGIEARRRPGGGAVFAVKLPRQGAMRGRSLQEDRAVGVPLAAL